jgi:hypothetical protein
LYTLLLYFIEELFEVLCRFVEGCFILGEPRVLPLFSKSPLLDELLFDWEDTGLSACGGAGRGKRKILT